MAVRSSAFDQARGDRSAFPYRLYGGATRADAISGLSDPFYSALMQLYAAAPPEVQRELGLNSAFRSIERQQELWNASDKTGRTVARPGHSHHNFGNAADLYGFGLGGNSSVSQVTKDWVHQNAKAHGLYFPMDYEPWHIQLVKEVADATGMSTEQASTVVANFTPEQRRNAIASIESAGSGDYGAVGPEADPAGHRARGRYQVMDYNIGPWAEQYLKMKGVTPEQFMADPALQDKLFDAVFQSYVDKYGEGGAAQAWFAGPGSVGKGGNAADVLGTTTNEYVKKYLNALQGTPHAQHPPNATVGTGGYVAPGANTTQVPADKQQPKSRTRNFLEAFGKGMEGMGGAGGGGFKYQAEPTPAAAITAEAPMPFANTEQQAMQRQELAQIMARLNSGKLWV